jgi:hypothetical protein
MRLAGTTLLMQRSEAQTPPKCAFVLSVSGVPSAEIIFIAVLAVHLGPGRFELLFLAVIYRVRFIALYVFDDIMSDYVVCGVANCSMEYDTLAIGLRHAFEASPSVLSAEGLEAITAEQLKSWFLPHDLPLIVCGGYFAVCGPGSSHA